MGYSNTGEETPITTSTSHTEPAETALHSSPADTSLEETSGVGMDEVFEILKNQRRQHVLRYLAAADGVVRLGEVAEHIAAWENDKAVHQITSQERKRVYVGLYQCHLPKMDDMGAIEFNKPRGRIERGPSIELFEQYLPPVDGEEGTEEAAEAVRWQLPLFSALLVPVVLLVAVWTSSELLLGAGAALLVTAAATAMFERIRD